MTQHIFTQLNKYAVVGKFMSGQTGSLLDIGARDKILAEYLDLKKIQYFSADLGEGYDYKLDLEKKIQLGDQQFDYTSALDVLEHVENIHQAFSELARITRHVLIIALPNMAVLSRRSTFFLHGHLGSGKYTLSREHPGDRHRWFTVYSEMNSFIEMSAADHHFKVQMVYEEMEWFRFFWRIMPLIIKLKLPKRGILTARCIYILMRNDQNL